MCFIYVLRILFTETADGFCSAYPRPNIVSLPDNCTYDNSTTIDKGVCDTNPCHGGEESSGCTRAATNCCGPTALAQVDVDCGTYQIPMYVVTSCGCTLCQEANFTIYGYAASSNDIALANGEIYWNGSHIANTSEDGTFFFTVELGPSKASILFVDVYNRTFMDSLYVFNMPTDTSESSYYIRVYLLPKGQTFELNATAENDFEMNDATITIPPGSFYTADGQPFTVCNTNYVLC